MTQRLRRQHGEGSLYQRSSDGLWVAVADLGWSGGKRQRRYFAARSPEDAIAKRSAFLAKRADGFTIPAGRQPYVGEWLLHWLHNVAKPKVQPTTWEGSYRQKVTELICPYFERVPLGELAEEDIEQWHRLLGERVSPRTGRPMAPATIVQCHRILSMALKVAVARGRMARNPAQNVHPPQAARPEPQPPTADETRQVIEACGEWPNGARWVLAITTGIRQGEALALRWADVKLAAPASLTVRASAAMVRGTGRVEKAPKSRQSRRTVPLPSAAVEALRAHRKAQVASIDGLVFTGPKGRPVYPAADWGDWKALLASLGLPASYRVHDLRHGYATMLLEQGIDPRVVMALLGWSSQAMLDVYQHVRPVLHQQAADAIDRALRG